MQKTQKSKTLYAKIALPRRMSPHPSENSGKKTCPLGWYITNGKKLAQSKKNAGAGSSRNVVKINLTTRAPSEPQRNRNPAPTGNQTCRLASPKEETHEQAPKSARAPPELAFDNNPAPKSARVLPELAFDNNPRLNFIFGPKTRDPPQIGSVPIINIDLKNNTDKAAQDNWVEGADSEEEEDEETLGNLHDLKKQLNAKAVQIFKGDCDEPATAAKGYQTERTGQENHKKLVDYSKYLTSPKKDDNVTKERRVTAVPSESIVERVLKRLCKNRELLLQFKEVTQKLRKTEKEETVTALEKLEEYKRYVSKLEHITHEISMEHLDNEIAFVKSLLTKPKGESIATICTAFDTPPPQHDKVQTHSNKYYNQINKLKTENAFLQTQMGRLESTFALISEKNTPSLCEKHLNTLYKTYDGLPLQPDKTQKHKGVLRALSKLSRQKAEQHKKLSKEYIECEKRYKGLCQRYLQCSQDLEKSQQVLSQTLGKVAQLNSLAQAKTELLVKTEEELKKAQDFIKRYFSKHSKQELTSSQIKAKENLAIPVNNPGKIPHIIKEAIAPLLNVLEQIYVDVNMYKKALTFSLSRNEAAHRIFVGLLEGGKAKIERWIKENAEEQKMLTEMLESSNKRSKVAEDFVSHCSVLFDIDKDKYRHMWRS